MDQAVLSPWTFVGPSRKASYNSRLLSKKSWAGFLGLKKLVDQIWISFSWLRALHDSDTGLIGMRGLSSASTFVADVPTRLQTTQLPKCLDSLQAIGALRSHHNFHYSPSLAGCSAVVPFWALMLRRLVAKIQSDVSRPPPSL